MAKLTLVYGGQWGSEGKGDVVSHIVRSKDDGDVTVSVRVGGPNAGHTILDATGVERKIQQIPCAAFIDPHSHIFIGASAVVDLHILDREMGWLRDIWGSGMPPVFLDKNATIITSQMRNQEATLKGAIGSTGEGVGAATAAKVMRQPLQTVWDHWESLQRTRNLGLFGNFEKNIVLDDTVRSLNILASKKSPHIIVEGTQGYLLSLNTSGNYPYVTSRDCGPEALMGQVGLSFRSFPVDQTRIVAVFRTFPIRVAGNSGPLPDELTWDDMRHITGGYVKQAEQTTVTKRDRRISRWDQQTALQTIQETRPTEIALTFLDYVYPELAGAGRWSELSPSCQNLVHDLSQSLLTPVSILSTKPHGCFDVDG
jgi:adenylosuccinate synthase